MAVVRSTLAAIAMVASTTTVAHAAGSHIPDWARPAVRYVDRAGIFDKQRLKPNRPITRRAFKKLMGKAFGPGYYGRTGGHAREAEVSRALVRALGKTGAARRLATATSPNGWRPSTPWYFGTEIVARSMELRHNRPTSEDALEAGALQPLRQADVMWAVWKAKTDPALYGAEPFAQFRLGALHGVRRKVVGYAFSLVGSPYVWAGEWPTATPPGYPYGAQAHGGFDCSGFVWNVLRAKSPDWNPAERPYKGWSLPERSSAGMAAATKKRLSYRKLRPGDVMFFAPGGRKSKAADVFHAGIYLGRGWMIHSSGSRAGVSIDPVASGSWWHNSFAWGRRVIKT